MFPKHARQEENVAKKAGPDGRNHRARVSDDAFEGSSERPTGNQQPGLAQTPSSQLELTQSASTMQAAPRRAGVTQTSVPP
jgi:hypothetical protein